MFLAEPPRSPDVDAMYDEDVGNDGYVWNNTRLWAYRPDVIRSFVELRARVTDASTLSEREVAVLVAATAGASGDSYCALAWGARMARLAGDDAAVAVLVGTDSAELTARESALASWARAVVADPNGTAQSDVDALRAAGLDDREIFDATAFVALRLAFLVVDDALGAAPDAPLAAAAPAAVRAAVTFGRPVDG
jgi:uncharacterized peroxidase-related enzyme